METKRFISAVQNEIDWTKKNHRPIQSYHEGLGILEEEFWEVKLEIFKKSIDKKALLGELVQVAAMCARVAEDLNLSPEEHPDKKWFED